MKENKNEEVKNRKGFVKISPFKNFHIKFNEYDIKIIKDEKIEVPEIFLANLKTEKVIK